MKNLNLFVFIILIISSLLTSCQKDQLEDMSPITNESTEQSINDNNYATSEKGLIDVNLSKKNISQTREVSSKRTSATSRSGSDQLINVSTCDNQSAIEKIKETLCFCEVNTLYHAEYFGEPALFVEQQCTEALDAGGISVYDCDGNQIAYTGFYTTNPVQVEHLDIKRKIYECSNGNDCLWGDDFERLPVGTNVAQETELWSAWTSESPSGIVTANKTLEFNRDRYGKQDIVFNLGKKSSKIYKVSWQMYIEANSAAYFNIQASNYRNEFVPGGEYRISFGTRSSQYQNRWFDVDVYFDLDRNKLKVIIDNGRFEREINYTADMGGINFYSVQDAYFYLDNVCVKEVNQIPLTNQTEVTSRSRSTDTGISTTTSKN